MSGQIFDSELVANLDRWAAETETGDREDLTFPMPLSAWSEVASDGDDCSPRTCPYRGAATTTPTGMRLRRPRSW